DASHGSRCVRERARAHSGEASGDGGNPPIQPSAHGVRREGSTMQTVNIFSPLIGGALMGIAASLLLWTHGRLAGIAGSYGGVLERVPDRAFRAMFVAGLIASGAAVCWLLPGVALGGGDASPKLAVAAGLLVGFGARLGGGCTSGHGICGMSRLSRRSIVATGVFMAVGVLAATAARHWLGFVP